MALTALSNIIYNLPIDSKPPWDYDYIYHPLVEGEERKIKDLIIQVPMAGVKKEDLGLFTIGNELHIRASNTRTPGRHIASRFHIDVNWQLICSNEVDVENISATLNHGLLVVTIPILKTELSVNHILPDLAK